MRKLLDRITCFLLAVLSPVRQNELGIMGELILLLLVLGEVGALKRKLNIVTLFMQMISKRNEHC